jgi:hypothetical protein
MSKHALSLLAGLALVLVANVARATPISSCTSNGFNYQCDLFESDSSGNPAERSTIFPNDPVLGVPEWLIGYTFVLDPGTNYTGTADNGNISDIVFIQPDSAELISDADPGFAAAITTALTATAAFTGADPTQIVGTPFLTGAQQFQGVGLVNEDASGVALLQDLFFAGGDGDSITVHSDVPGVNPPPTGVPEPATISLMSIGALGVVVGRWRLRKGSRQRTV